MAIGYGTKFERVTWSELKSFVKKRIGKIYPFYLITMVWAAIFEILRMQIEQQLTLIEVLKVLIKLILSASMLQASTIKYWGILNSAAWFISTIFVCYVCTPFILCFLRKWKGNIKKLTGFSFSVYLLITAVYLMVWIFFGRHSEIYELHLLLYASPYFRILFYILGIVAGISFGQTRDANRGSDKSGIQIVSLLLSGLCYFLFVNSREEFYYGEQNILLLPIVILWLYAFSNKGFFVRALGSRLFQWSGKLSMYFYLFHYVVINYGGRQIFEFFFESSDLILAIQCFVLLAVTLVLSVMAGHYQEKLVYKLKSGQKQGGKNTAR